MQQRRSNETGEETFQMWSFCVLKYKLLECQINLLVGNNRKGKLGQRQDKLWVSIYHRLLISGMQSLQVSGSSDRKVKSSCANFQDFWLNSEETIS